MSASPGHDDDETLSDTVDSGERGGGYRGDPEPDLGRALGLSSERFRVGAILGVGGMGTVVEAYDEVLGREVALKLMREEATINPQFRDRFLREAKAAASIDHPNLVRVYDVDPARCILIMERVRGEALSVALRRDGALPPERARDLVLQVLRGLEAVHEAGVVHRDVKPANVLLTDDGVAKIGDFGVARVGESDLTQTGQRVGTPAYMAPEQLRGARVDARADLYAVGLVLYELLAGERFHREDGGAADLDARLAELRAPPGLVAVLRRALAEDRDERFESASAMRVALESGAVATRPAPRARARRRPLVAVAVTVATLAVGLWLATRDGGPAPVTTVARGDAEQAPRPAPPPEPPLALPEPVEGPAREAIEGAVARLYGLARVDAEPALEAVLAARPGDAAAQYYLCLSRGFGAAPDEDLRPCLELARPLEMSVARRAVMTAAQAYLDRDWDACRAATAAALEQDPDHWELLYAHGECEFHGQRFEAGIEAMNRAGRLQPRFLLPRYHPMDFALARGDRETLDRWVDASERHGMLGRTSDTTGYRVRWYLSTGEPRRALELLGEVPEVDPSALHVWALLLAAERDRARAAAARMRSYRRGDRPVPDGYVMAALAHAAGDRASWRRSFDLGRRQSGQDLAIAATWREARAAIALVMLDELEEAGLVLAEARDRVGEPHRALEVAQALLAWRRARADELPVDPGREAAFLSRAIRADLTGDRRAALDASFEGLGRASDCAMFVPIAWFAARVARGFDEEALARACGEVLTPRDPHGLFVYAAAACAP